MINPVRVSYQTVEFGELDIHLCTLRDKQQFNDPDNIAKKLGISSALWPIFGVIWPSGLVLAHYMDDFETKEKRILEIGCGMALSSLLLNKKHVDITATDHHPEVGVFLNRNTLLNNDQLIDFERVDWADKTDTLGLFDVIIGSDLLYEDQHIELLACFIEKHANASCEVILVDPGRGRKNKISDRMTAFGFQNSHNKPVATDYLTDAFKGHILRFWR